MAQSRERLALRHTLEGHRGWVTSLATSTENPDLLLSASRDKTLLIWQLTHDSENYAIPRRALTGHNHFVQEVALTSDGLYAMSASWDKTLRLWDLTAGVSSRRYVGHNNDVLSVSFSADNRSIVSGSRDKSIKVWNSQGDCAFTIEGAHTEWVSCVRFSPNLQSPIVISAGWDKLVKVWDLSETKIRTNHIGHKGYINSIAVSPDGSLCASGGKDGIPMLWDLNDGKHLYALDAGEEIHALCFSPNRYWLCAATTRGIRIWDLQTKEPVDTAIVEDDDDFELNDNGTKKSVPPTPLSLAWSTDGQTLFAGYTDNKIRVWDLVAY